MNLDEIPLFSMLKGRMGYLAERQRVIAENVANSDTPGYAARDMKPFTFKAALGSAGGNDAFGSSTMLEPASTQTGHMSQEAPNFGPSTAIQAPRKADSETTINGNGVVLEDEMMKMTEARMDYDTAVGFYQKAMDMLRLATRAPGK
jgi:flagellar basal-body rod protein FlgB